MVTLTLFEYFLHKLFPQGFVKISAYLKNEIALFNRIYTRITYFDKTFPSVMQNKYDSIFNFRAGKI